jgi:hypothetical protein
MRWATASHGAVLAGHSNGRGTCGEKADHRCGHSNALLTAGCAGTPHSPASLGASPASAGATRASTAARADSNPACTAQLSAWRPAGERFEHTLLQDAGAAESDLQSLITQAEEGAQPSINAAALTHSGTLASIAKHVLDRHLPPPCVPHMRAALTASMLNFEKQAAGLNNASLALSDWTTRERNGR